MKNFKTLSLGFLILSSFFIYGCEDSSLETSVQPSKNIIDKMETESKKILEEELILENELENLENLNPEKPLENLEIQSEKILEEENSIEDELNSLENLDF